MNFLRMLEIHKDLQKSTTTYSRKQLHLLKNRDFTVICVHAPEKGPVSCPGVCPSAGASGYVGWATYYGLKDEEEALGP